MAFTITNQYNSILFTDATIGFVSTTLTVDEGVGTASFEIGVLSGILRINVNVLFDTSDGSAHGMQVCSMPK